VPDPAIFNGNKQSVAILHVIDDLTTIGQRDGGREVFKALVVATENDRDRNVVSASGDTLAHTGKRGQCIVEPHKDKRDLVASRSGIGHDPQFAMPGQGGLDPEDSPVCEVGSGVQTSPVCPPAA
jgi:hypothetical protein